MAKKKFYVVWEGKETGIFDTWAECKSLIDGHKGAKYKSFPTYEEAKEAFFNKPPTPSKNITKKPKKAFREEMVTELLEKGHIVIFTDGGALGNPGRGGYGAVLQFIHKGEILRRELSGGFRETTNNRMEIMAVIKALESVKSDKPNIDLFSDSKYVVDANNLGWAKGWKKNNWIKSNKEEAKNSDLWEILLNLTSRLNVTFHWVKGHAGIIENEKCDELANIVMKEQDLPADEFYEAIQQ
ncbi:MAG: ribonuclease HI [Campylobacterales bacterium]|nr:ribonuclease HI [Campylobacterales bacterium]